MPLGERCAHTLTTTGVSGYLKGHSLLPPCPSPSAPLSPSLSLLVYLSSFPLTHLFFPPSSLHSLLKSLIFLSSFSFFLNHPPSFLFSFPSDAFLHSSISFNLLSFFFFSFPRNFPLALISSLPSSSILFFLIFLSLLPYLFRPSLLPLFSSFFLILFRSSSSPLLPSPPTFLPSGVQGYKLQVN